MSSLLASILQLARVLLERVYGQKDDPARKKSEAAKRDHSMRNKHEEIVARADDEDEAVRRQAMEDLRRRASE